jgi:DtxR family Mn-dependent transcriptional regulator
VVALPDALPGGGPADVLVRRLGEPLQTDLALMGELSRLGVRPGRQVRAERTGGPGGAVRVGTAAGSLEVPAPAAHHVFVVPVGVS